jgi:biopolymer transport protein ExbD
MLMLVAPTVQLAFILVFFLLLSSTFLLQPGVAVTVPQSPFLLEPEKNPHVITITAPPLAAVFFDNEQITLPALRERLARERRHARTVVIKADRHALYEMVANASTVALELGFPVVLATAEKSP